MALGIDAQYGFAVFKQARRWVPQVLSWFVVHNDLTIQMIIQIDCCRVVADFLCDQKSGKTCHDKTGKHDPHELTFRLTLESATRIVIESETVFRARQLDANDSFKTAGRFFGFRAQLEA